MNLQPNQEIVLLLETDSRLRAFPIPKGAHTVLERCHGRPGETTERFWLNEDGERAMTGQRVFREVLPPAPAEEPEHPLYNELHVTFPDDALPPPGSGTRRLFRRGLLALRRGGRVK